MKRRGNMFRRPFPSAKTNSFALLLFICLLNPCIGISQSAPKAAVTGGEIQGRMLEGGGAVFLGIPYAQPPVGELRWREPMPVKPWPEVRDATKYGPPCTQMGQKGFSGSEDCLYLNVFAPDWPLKSPHPAMVRPLLPGRFNYVPRKLE